MGFPAKVSSLIVEEYLAFESIGLSLTLAEIYHRVTFSAHPEGEEAL